MQKLRAERQVRRNRHRRLSRTVGLVNLKCGVAARYLVLEMCIDVMRAAFGSRIDGREIRQLLSRDLAPVVTEKCNC